MNEPCGKTITLQFLHHRLETLIEGFLRSDQIRASAGFFAEGVERGSLCRLNEATGVLFHRMMAGKGKHERKHALVPTERLDR